MDWEGKYWLRLGILKSENSYIGYTFTLVEEARNVTDGCLAKTHASPHSV